MQEIYAYMTNFTKGWLNTKIPMSTWLLHEFPFLQGMTDELIENVQYFGW